MSSTKTITFVINNVQPALSFLVDKATVLELPERSGAEASGEYAVTIKTNFSLAALQNIVLQILAPSVKAEFKKVLNLVSGTFFHVSFSGNNIEVRQTEDKEGHKTFGKKSTAAPVKKWATVETKKKPVAPPSAATTASAVIETGSTLQQNEMTKIHFYFGNVVYDGEIEPVIISINEKEVFSSSSGVNGEVVEIEVPVPKLGFDHRITLGIEAPGESRLSKRVNLTEGGYHVLVKRPSREKVEIEQQQDGASFAGIAAEEKKKQTPAEETPQE